MKSLFVFATLLVMAAAAPQYLWPYGAMVVKGASNYETMKLTRGLVHVPLSSDYYYVPVPVRTHDMSSRALKPLVEDNTLLVAVANQDTNRGLIPTIEDTVEVKEAKELFKVQYEKAAIAAALAPERHRRDVVGVETPASTQRLQRQLAVPVILPAAPAAYWPHQHSIYHPASIIHAPTPLFY